MFRKLIVVVMQVQKLRYGWRNDPNITHCDSRFQQRQHVAIGALVLVYVIQLVMTFLSPTLITCTRPKTGRASCRERWCTYVEIWELDGSLYKKNIIRRN